MENNTRNKLRTYRLAGNQSILEGTTLPGVLSEENFTVWERRKNIGQYLVAW